MQSIENTVLCFVKCVSGNILSEIAFLTNEKSVCLTVLNCHNSEFVLSIKRKRHAAMNKRYGNNNV